VKDEEYGALLLRPLAEEPGGVPRIDVARAMRDGRRMRGRRWWAGGSAVVAAVAAASVGGALVTAQDKPDPKVLPPDPPVPTSCTASLLPIGRHPDADVAAGDPSGTWHTGVSEPNYHEPPLFNSLLIWRNGKLVADAKVPAAGFMATDVNGSGVAIGFNDAGADQPYAYRDGKFHKLAGGYGNPAAINDAGVIVGNVGREPNKAVPVRWSSVDGAAEPLEIPAGVRPTDIRVRDVAEDGSIIGEIGRAGYLWRPDGTGGYIVPPKGSYPRPSMSPVPRPSFAVAPGVARPSIPEGGVPVPDASSVAFDPQFTPLSFSHGWIYGELLSEPTMSLAYRYDPRSGTWQRLGDAGTMMAYSGNGLFAGNMAGAFVGQAVLPLPPPGEAASPREGENSMSLTSISDDARTVAGTMISGRADPSHRDKPVIWRCR
jgi:hypothetical protein